MTLTNKRLLTSLVLALSLASVHASPVPTQPSASLPFSLPLPSTGLPIIPVDAPSPPVATSSTANDARPSPSLPPLPVPALSMSADSVQLPSGVPAGGPLSALPLAIPSDAPSAPSIQSNLPIPKRETGIPNILPLQLPTSASLPSVETLPSQSQLAPLASVPLDATGIVNPSLGATIGSALPVAPSSAGPSGIPVTPSSLPTPPTVPPSKRDADIPSLSLPLPTSSLLASISSPPELLPSASIPTPSSPSASSTNSATPPTLPSLALSIGLPLPIQSGQSIADLDRSRIASMISGLGQEQGQPGDVQSAVPSVSIPVSVPAPSAPSAPIPSAPTPSAPTVSAPVKRAPQPQSIPVTNSGVLYTAQISIGSPAQPFTVLVDTGSSNTWVGANPNKKYNVRGSRSGKSENRAVSVSYGSGKFSGQEYTDTLSLSSALTIPSQSFGSATSSSGFSDGVDGILGLGPTSLTRGTIQGMGTVPTVVDNLAKAGKIPGNVIGVGFSPITTNGGQGSISFGAPDNGKTTSEITYTNIPTSGPASNFWGLQTTMSYGSKPLIASPKSGFLDTGTTLLLLSNSAFNAYQSATGAQLDSATGLLKVSQEQFDKMESLRVSVGGKNFEVTKDAQRWPRALNTQIGGDDGSVYLIVGNLGGDNSSIDFVLGYTFLERFYSVYDADRRRVGLAATQFTTMTVNN